MKPRLEWPNRNEKALDAFEKSGRQDHLRATVTSTLKGDVNTVSTIFIID